MPAPQVLLRPDSQRSVVAKDQQITVRATEEEKQNIEQKAEAAGLSVSRFLVESALSGDEMMSSEEREELVEELRALYREVRSSAGNINQIAARLNQGRATGGKAVESALEEIERASESVSEKMEEVL